MAAGEWAALLKLGEAPVADDGVTVAQLNEVSSHQTLVHDIWICGTDAIANEMSPF